ncbi:MAG: LuxR C-terminal-related transcriptional regulator [Anaerolineae bacterium]
MVMSILSSKLQIPPLRSDLVQRPRLTAHLNTGLQRKLTLISAPAGFGKTTVASAWINESGYPAAWLSLDERDNDPMRFLAYLAASLQTIDADLGHTLREAMQGSQPPPPDAILTTLLNDIAALSNDVLLVLDDYHTLESPEVDNMLSFILEHLPPQMHLVIITREDPQIPLARLRVRNQLTELRITHLRFTPDEAAEFLNQVMGLTLSAQDVAALEKRTEGWIAGLQLAALSLQGRADAATFIDAFKGSHRFVVDYLLEEVLDRQPEPVKQFLLQTSVLQRLCSSLCDAVTGRADSQKTLEMLERSNLFVIPLDHERQWYRYHHLFADALHNHLQAEPSVDVSALHQRASDWYTQHDLPQDALHHALGSGNFHQAADLLEHLWPVMDENYQAATWFTWAKSLPEDIIRSRPLLCIDCGWTLMYKGELEASEAWLQAAEGWLKAPFAERQTMRAADDRQLAYLPASISSARTYRALALGDIPATLQFAAETLALVGNADHPSRTQATALSGIAHWANGNLTAAIRILSDFVMEMQSVGRMVDTIELTFVIADMYTTCGQLNEAYRTYDRAFKLLSDLDNPLLMGMEDLHRGISDLHREWNRLDVAEDHLLAAEELSEQLITRPDWRHRLCISWARLRVSQQQFKEALALLDEAQTHYIRTPLPILRSAEAMKARIWIMQGNLDDAGDWIKRQGLSAESEITYLREFDLVTLARFLIARRKGDDLAQARHLLGRLRSAAETEARTGTGIEILILQALMHHAEGDLTAALVSLRHALTLAEPQGYIRLFVDEGAPMLAVLQQAAARGIAPDYVHHLITAFDRAASPQYALAQPLIDPLSERELDVLRMLKTDLTGPEIARQLVVSLSTMRTHTRNIYSKLGVNNRRAAVRRAEELTLL